MGESNKPFNRAYAMKVSVITPTADREHFLKGTYRLLKNQTYSDWEWLIYDTSLKPTPFDDPRVIYIHDQGIMTIGEKRNRLIAQSSGDFVIHFDDDDYYSPTYLEKSVARLKKTSFFTLHGWFSYDLKTEQFFYWDTDEMQDIRYSVNALSGLTVREIDFGPYPQAEKDQLNIKGKMGYGFSFIYTKEVAKECHFEDIDFAEDRYFYENAVAKGFSISTEADHIAEVIHVIHDTNTSTEFPQYRIPHFLVRPLCPLFFTHLKQLHEN